MSNTAVTLVGNATKDPELRFTPSGLAIATFGVAVNRRTRNQTTQEWEDATPEFFDVVCWRELAENVCESITKGTRIVVVGRLSQRSWETDAGDRRSKVEVTAEEVGASLRWATSTVTRHERSTGDYATPAAPGEEPFRVDAGTWSPADGWGTPPERMLP